MTDTTNSTIGDTVIQIAVNVSNFPYPPNHMNEKSNVYVITGERNRIPPNSPPAIDVKKKVITLLSVCLFINPIDFTDLKMMHFATNMKR